MKLNKLRIVGEKSENQTLKNCQKSALMKLNKLRVVGKKSENWTLKNC